MKDKTDFREYDTDKQILAGHITEEVARFMRKYRMQKILVTIEDDDADVCIGIDHKSVCTGNHLRCVIDDVVTVEAEDDDDE